MSELICPKLWTALRQGLHEAREVGRKYVESGKYVPRHSTVKITESSWGWPSFDHGGYLGKSDGGIDWNALLGEGFGRGRYIPLDELPNFVASIEGAADIIESDADLLAMFSPLSALKDEEHDKRYWLEMEVKIFISALLDRAAALTITSDQDLEAIYAQLEQGRLAPSLRGDLIVPIIAVSFDSTEPVQVAGDLWIEPLSDDLQRARAASWRHGQASSRNFVSATATHALVQRGVEFDNFLHRSNFRGSPTERLTADFSHAFFEALAVVTDTASGYSQLLIRPDGWAESWDQDLPPLCEMWRGRAYPEAFDDGIWRTPRTQISADALQRLVQAAVALSGAPESVRIASRRLRRIAFRESREDSVLDAAIGVEALLGGDREEITHRISQRAAVALADGFPPSTIYDLVKKFYGVRSAVVHGRLPRKWACKLGDHEVDAIELGEFLLRELLNSNVLADVPWTRDSLDAQLLTALEREPPAALE